MNINFNRSKPPTGVFARVLTAVASVVLLIGAFMFSLVFFAVIAVAGVILWLYFWWKTRAIRAHLRQQMEQQGRGQAPDSTSPASAPASGEIIEGEAVRVVEERNRLAE